LKNYKNLNKYFILLLLILFGIGSCITPIGVALKKHEKLNGKKIRVKGRIISSIELSNIKCFTIKDKTGKIFVVTNNLLPLKEDYIKIKGKLNSSFRYKKQQIIAIEEKKIKLKKLKYPSYKKRKKAGKRNIK